MVQIGESVQIEEEESVRIDIEESIHIDIEEAIHIDIEEAIHIEQAIHIEESIHIEEEESIHIEEEKSVQIGEQSKNMSKLGIGKGHTQTEALAYIGQLVDKESIHIPETVVHQTGVGGWGEQALADSQMSQLIDDLSLCNRDPTVVRLVQASETLDPEEEL